MSRSQVGASAAAIFSGQQARGLREALALPPGAACVHGGEVGFPDVRQQRGADGSMWRGEHAADGRGESVDGTEAGVGERDAGIHRGARDISSRAARSSGVVNVLSNDRAARRMPCSHRASVMGFALMET